MVHDRRTRSGAPKARSQTKPQSAAKKRDTRARKAAETAANPKTGKQRRQQKAKQAKQQRRALELESARVAAQLADMDAKSAREQIDNFNVKVLPQLLELMCSDEEAKSIIIELSAKSARDEVFKSFTRARAQAAVREEDELNEAGELKIMELFALRCKCAPFSL